MMWNITYISWVHMLTAIISMQLVFTVYRMKQIRGRVPFLCMMLLAAYWSLILTFESAVPSMEEKIMFSRFEYFANMLIPLYFVNFIFSYDLEKPNWLKRSFWILWIIPVCTLLLVFTNNYHHLIWKGYTWSPDGNNILIYHHGLLFYFAMAYSLLLIVFGNAMMIYYIRKRPRYYKSQVWFLISASVFPVFTGLIYIIGLSPLEGLDISPMGILLSGLIFFWGISREQLFDIVPAGHQLMIEKMNDGVIVLDKNNFVMDLNPAAKSALKIEETIRGAKLETAIPSLREIATDVLPGEKLRKEVFLTAPINRWFEIMRNPLNDENEKKLGTLLIIHDITHRKRAEDQLKKLANDLTELNAMKDRLYSIIGHDLRSPFNSILGFAELLATSYDEFSDEDRKTFANNILAASRNTFELLENLLEWSRIQMGRTPFIPEEINLNLAVNEAFHLMRLNADSKNIHLVAEVPSQQMVYADHNMLNTILRNTISNGIKFTSKGGSVKVSSTQDQGKTRIKIADNGVGMVETIQKKLFRIDSLISTPGTANEKGTGLGLILCKEFVEKHGGTIQVESRIGEGTTFTLDLPGIPAV
jgi:PAS domain S-box-containing protein